MRCRAVNVAPARAEINRRGKWLVLSRCAWRVQLHVAHGQTGKPGMGMARRHDVCGSLKFLLLIHSVVSGLFLFLPPLPTIFLPSLPIPLALPLPSLAAPFPVPTPTSLPAPPAPFPRSAAA